jgi:hypothetical protein
MAAFHFSGFAANGSFHFPPRTAKGTVPTSILPDSRHSLCIYERQLRSGRNFASTPGFYALIREIFEGEFFSGAMVEQALCPEAENNSKNRFPFTKKMGRLAIIVCALER